MPNEPGTARRIVKLEERPFALTPTERKKLRLRPRKTGHIAPPGTGPEGETCGSCQHLFRNHMSKTYLKCELNRARWTGGGGTDVRAKDPACREWTKPEVSPLPSFNAGRG